MVQQQQQSISPVDFPSKAAWRRWARQVRSGLDLGTSSTQICEQLSAVETFVTARHILLYLPLSTEIDLRPLATLHPHKSWGIPRCLPEAQLAWHCWDPRRTDVYVQGRFGLLEPRADAPLMDLDQVELVLVPGMAFDLWGGRLGYGKGYYDRFLARYPGVKTIGICPQACLLSTPLPSDPWDVPMQGVITEEGLVSVQPDPKPR